MVHAERHSDSACSNAGFRILVERFSRDFPHIPLLCQEGRGLIGYRFIFRRGDAEEVKAGYSAPGIGAYLKFVFVRFESAENRMRPSGVPIPESLDDHYLVIMWIPQKECYVRYVSHKPGTSFERSRTSELIKQDLPLIREACQVVLDTMAQEEEGWLAPLAAMRLLSVAMPVPRGLSLGSQRQITQQEMLALACDETRRALPLTGKHISSLTHPLHCVRTMHLCSTCPQLCSHVVHVSQMMPA
jgi:hypothetical protein